MRAPILGMARYETADSRNAEVAQGVARACAE